MVAAGTLSGGISSAIAGGSFWDGMKQGLIVSLFNEAAHYGQKLLTKGAFQKGTDQNGGKGEKKGEYKTGNGYAEKEKSITPKDFFDRYKGQTESQITKGKRSFMGYTFPSDMADKNTRFVKLDNGNEVDMLHFMVVGREGHVLGLVNETQQLFAGSNSAFNPQDLYSNKLGIDFFNQYSNLIEDNPTKISNYIYDFFNSTNVLYPTNFDYSQYFY